MTEKRPAILHRETSVRMSDNRSREIKYLLRKHLPQVIKQRAEAIEKNAKYARLCVLDAFQGRLGNGLATNSKKSKFIFTIFSLQTSDILLNTVVISCALHTLSVFFEPTQTCSTNYLLFFFHLIVSLIHLSDVGLKMYYEGFWVYWDHDWQRLYLITTVANFLDLMVNGKTHYTNFLRPVVGLLRARSFRRFFTIVQRMIPGLTETLTPMFVFLVMIMVICGIVFDNRLEQFKEANFTSYNWFWMIYTNDTYDNLLPYELVNDALYVAFFFISIYLGQKFLLSLILGATFDTFREFTKKQLRDERNKQLQGLVKAFAALDDHKTGIISEAVFCALLSKFTPGITPEEKALYYELISSGSSSGGVNVLQFLNLRDILNYSFVRVRDSYTMQISEGFQQKYEKYVSMVVLPTPKGLRNVCEQILTKYKKYNIRDWTNFFDIVLISFGLHDFTALWLLGLSPCILISAMYIFEFYITILHEEGKLINILNNGDLFPILFLVGWSGMLISYFNVVVISLVGFELTSLSWLAALLISSKFRLAMRFLRCMRITRMNKDLSTFINAMIDVMPLFCQSMTFALIVTYIFAMMGNLLFGSNIEKWDSPLKSMVVMNQLFLPANFVTVMEEAMEQVHPLTCIFFSIYFILSLLVGNLSLSVIIEWYGENVNDKSNEARESAAKADDQLFKNIINRATAKRVLTKRKGSESLFFGDIRYSKRTSTDHRVKLVGGSTVDLEDLQKAQKYSNINLTTFYNEQYRRHKDVNAEVKFIRSARESGACEEKKYQPGDVLFEVGSSATDVYLVIMGDVTLKDAKDADLDVQVQAVSAVGYEALQPKGKYTLTCVADTVVDCLIFSQDNITIDMDTELAGDLLRLVFKCEAQYEVLMEEKKKLVSRRSKGRVPSFVQYSSSKSLPKVDMSSISEEDVI